MYVTLLYVFDVFAGFEELLQSSVAPQAVTALWPAVPAQVGAASWP